jgi:hypothetical protein
MKKPAFAGSSPRNSDSYAARLSLSRAEIWWTTTLVAPKCGAGLMSSNSTAFVHFPQRGNLFPAINTTSIGSLCSA